MEGGGGRGEEGGGRREGGGETMTSMWLLKNVYVTDTSLPTRSWQS